MRDEIRNEKAQEQQQQPVGHSFTEITDEQLKGIYGGAGALGALLDGQKPLGNLDVVSINLPIIGRISRER